MSCVLCCCWRRKQPDADNLAKLGPVKENDRQHAKLDTEEIEAPRASDACDSHSIGSRSSLDRHLLGHHQTGLTVRVPDINVIVASYNESAASPTVAPPATPADEKSTVPKRVEIVKPAAEPQETKAAAATSYTKANVKAAAGRGASSGVAAETKQAKASSRQRAEGLPYSMSTCGLYFEDQGYHSNHASGVHNLMHELEPDSFQSEFVENPFGRISLSKTEYLPYSGAETLETADNLAVMGLRKQRADFLSKAPELAQQAIVRINEERANHGSAKLKVTADLNEIARLLWQDRVQVLDGFVTVPRCVFFPRVTSGPVQRFGCLTYYTPRSAKPDCLPEAMVSFWSSGGAERPGTRDFPTAKEPYARPDSRMSEAFEKYRKDFCSQLLSCQCTRVGLYMDMVRVAPEGNANVVCVAAVFDHVANAKGREMKYPFASQSP